MWDHCLPLESESDVYIYIYIYKPPLWHCTKYLREGSLIQASLKTGFKDLQEAEVTCCGKLFQRRGPATTKDRSPRVEWVV